MENAELLEQLLAAIEQSEMRLEMHLREEVQNSQELLRKEIREGQDALRQEIQGTLRQEIRDSQEALKKDLIEQVVDQLNLQLEAIETIIDKKIAEAETRVNVKIENEVDGKLKALFDGYQSAHEKQWELERRTGQLQDQVDGLEIRVETLESKTA